MYTTLKFFFMYMDIASPFETCGKCMQHFNRENSWEELTCEVCIVQHNSEACDRWAFFFCDNVTSQLQKPPALRHCGFEVLVPFRRCPCLSWSTLLYTFLVWLDSNELCGLMLVIYYWCCYRSTFPVPTSPSCSWTRYGWISLLSKFSQSTVISTSSEYQCSGR